MSTKILNDKLGMKDLKVGDVLPGGNKVFKTKILGYDDFGNQLFEEENITVLPGALFTVEKLFRLTNDITDATKEKALDVALGINTQISNSRPTEEFIVLFGVGTGGATDVVGSIKPTYYTDSQLAGLFPIRCVPVNTPLVDKYYVHKTQNIGGTNYECYYCKAFDSTPTLSVLRHMADGSDGPELTREDLDSKTNSLVDTFVSMTIKIDKTDAREWFELNGNVEAARINALGLYTAWYDSVTQQYRNVRLFSELHFQNEILHLSKSLTLVYRIYLAS